MKQLLWILALLTLLGVLIAVPVIARRQQPGPDCRDRVLIVKGAHGEPLECVCIEGTLATCFSPGP
jgi:hypothetical protein